MVHKRSGEAGGPFGGEPGEALGGSMLSLAGEFFNNLAELAAAAGEAAVPMEKRSLIDANMRAVEQSVEALNEYNEQSQRFFDGLQEMCRHLIMVHATVLGLTVGLLGAYGTPTLLLKGAWVMMIVAVALGFALLGAQLRLRQRIAHRNFRMHATAIIGSREMAKGNWTAAADQLLLSSAFVDLGGQAFVEETASKFGLPPKKYLEERTRLAKQVSPKGVWRLTWAFYVSSALAFLLLLLSVTCRQPDRAPASLSSAAAATSELTSQGNKRSVSQGTASPCSVDFGGPTRRLLQERPSGGSSIGAPV